MPATWIKLHDDLHEDPRVFRMGQILAKTADHYITRTQARDLLGDVTQCVTRDALRDITIAGLARVWRAANRHTTDGTFRHATLDYLDTLAHIPGFGSAMAAVGWASETPDTGVTLPNFLEHNEPDKNGKRAKTHAERQADYRERQRQKTLPDPPVTDTPQTVNQVNTVNPVPPCDTPCDANNVTSNVTRDTKSDENSSYSSSNSESKNSDSGKEESRGEKPTDTLTALETAKARINRMRQSWAKLPHWTCEEEHALSESLANVHALQDQDWCIIAHYLRWCHGSVNQQSKDPVRVTSRRHTFVRELPALYDRAVTHWKQTGSPRLNPDGTKASPKIVPFAPEQRPKPEEPPLPPSANAAAFAGLLAANGVKRSPIVATNPA